MTKIMAELSCGPAPWWVRYGVMVDAGAPRHHFGGNGGVTPVFYHLLPFIYVFDPTRFTKIVDIGKCKL